MLTPEFLAGCSDDIVEIWADTEVEILSDIARRIAKNGYITDTAAWQIEKARQLGVLNGDVAKALEKAYGKSTKEVDHLFLEAAKIAMEADNEIFLAAGIEAALLEFTPAQRAILLQGTKTTKMLLESYTHTTAKASELAFRNAADKAYLGIMSGAFDTTTAIRRSINELAKGNIESVAYPSGANHSMEAATRRAIVTGCNQSVAKLQLARAEDLGCELVEVSSHAGARPSHAEWQGDVYCISGKSGKYKDFYQETGYGDGDGLCGWNCYHNFWPYFEGLSRRAFSKDPSADAGRSNAEDYENSQKQRAMERAVREAKKECTVLDKAIKASDNSELSEQLNRDFQRASVKLKSREAKLSEFIDKTGRTRLREREQSPKFGHSVSSKAVWTNKKEKEFRQILEIAGKSGTIELSQSMENYIANKPFSDIQGLVGKLSDKAARKWYIANDAKIAASIEKSLSLEAQARIAHERRNANRTAARDLMADQEKRKLLDINEPNKTFEELLQHKMNDKHLTHEEALQDIIATASKTRSTINTSLGLGDN